MATEGHFMPFLYHSLALSENKSHLRLPGWQALVASSDAGRGSLPGRGWQRGYQAGIWSQPFAEMAQWAWDKKDPSGWKFGESEVGVSGQSSKGFPCQQAEPLPRPEVGRATAALPPRPQTWQEPSALPLLLQGGSEPDRAPFRYSDDAWGGGGKTEVTTYPRLPDSASRPGSV